MSKIEWTGETWNPLVGCTIHSAGCKGCYAMKDAYRLMHNPHPAIAAKFAGTAKMVNGHAVWTGRINFDEATLMKPLRRRTPTTYFVNSMSDLFHGHVADEQIDRIFAVMALCPQHTFQILTKRASRMRDYLTRPGRSERVAAEARSGRYTARFSYARWEGGSGAPVRAVWPLANVWFGVSVEDQRSADERIPDLIYSPAAVRFLSCEPLIGPVDLTSIKAPREPDEPDLDTDWRFDALEIGDYYWFDCGDGFSDGGDGPYREHRIDWVIAGGETGRSARPMHPEWVRALRDQCANASLHGDAAPVPFFFKQWGNRLPSGQAMADGRIWSGGGDGRALLTTKRYAGRLLDGVEHNGMPE